jgi:hypothetical protein
MEPLPGRYGSIAVALFGTALHFFQAGLHFLEINRAQARRGQTHGQSLDIGSYDVELLEIRYIQRLDAHLTARRPVQEAIMFQAQKRFAYRASAGPESQRQLRLAEPLTRCDFPANECAANPGIGVPS